MTMKEQTSTEMLKTQCSTTFDRIPNEEKGRGVREKERGGRGKGSEREGDRGEREERGEKEEMSEI